MDTARHTAAELADKAKTQAGDLVDKAKDTASEHLSEGKDKATGVLSDVAEALHKTSDTLRDNDQDAFARYADIAAREVEQFTSAIRGRSVGDLLDEAEAFARRDPGLFLGGAFVLGIFGARFLKAGTGGMTGGGSGSTAGRSSSPTSARSLLSGLQMPGGSPSAHEHVANVNRPEPGAYGDDLRTTGGTTSGSTGGSRSGGMPGGMTGSNLPASSPAAAGRESMGTAVGTPPPGSASRTGGAGPAPSGGTSTQGTGGTGRL